MGKKSIIRPVKKATEKNLQKEVNIINGALKVFGEKGFEGTTISAIAKAAEISDATVYEYFSSKEEILFSIAEYYTKKEYERVMAIEPYVHGARERMRMVIQVYLDFYENNRLYTSVALLTLKGSRNFLKSKAYLVVRQAAQSIVDIYKEGLDQGVFRDDLDPYLVRNMVLGFIEHLTIQWLLLGRPQSISVYRDIIFDMVMRAIEKRPDANAIDLKVRVEGLEIRSAASGTSNKNHREG